jgi:hypothetical protein
MYAFVGLASAAVGAMTWVARKKKERQAEEGYYDIPLGPTAKQVFDSKEEEVIQDGAKTYSRLMDTVNVTTDPNFVNSATASAYANSLQALGGTVGIGSDGNLSVEVNKDLLVPTDIDNSVMQYVRECEAVLGTNKNPFTNAKFAERCGFCHEGGKNSSGTDTLGGLYVSDTQKESDSYNARREGKKYPAYTPSVGSCRPGYFSVSAADYDRIQRQKECAALANFSVAGCVQCADTEQFVFVNSLDAQAPVKFRVVGEGALTFRHGSAAAQTLTLKNDVQEINPVNPIREGDMVYIGVEKTGTAEPYVAGVFFAPTVTGTYVADLGRLAAVDTITGAKPRIRGSTTVEGTPSTILRPASGKTGLNLQVNIPYTFLEPNDEDAQKCPSGPLITLEASAQKLSSGPCFAKGSAQGKYSLDCIRQVWTDAGCTQAGEDYPADLIRARTLAGADPLSTLADRFYALAQVARTGINAAGTRVSLKERDDAGRRCTGKRYGNPCDMYDNGEALGVDCLDYLYKNTDGAACQASGKGAPIGASGQENKAVIDALQKLGSVDAVKQHYRDVYRRAVDNSAADADRESAVEQCFGTGFYYNRVPTPIVKPLDSTLTNPTAGQKTAFERVSYGYPGGVKGAVVLGKYGIAPWGSPMQGGFSDTQAFWIWDRAGAQNGAPIYALTELPAFYYVYNHPGGSPINVRLDFIIDNIGDVYVNGELIGLGHSGGYAGDFIQNGNRKNIRLLPGSNLIKIVAQNQGGPAGLIAAAFNDAGAVLFHTDDQWKTKPAYDLLTPSSIEDLDNYGVYQNNSVSNLIKAPANDGLQWNPIATAQMAGTKTYRLLVKFDGVKNVSFLRFLTSGDRTHDPTAIRIYRDESKSEMAGSYGSLAGRQTTDVMLHQNMFTTDKLYIEIDKTSQYQLWLHRIQFFHNN